MDRRTLLKTIVGAFGAVAAVGVSVPFLRSMFPTWTNEVILDVDVSGLAPGAAKQVRWLGRNVLIVHRDERALQSLGTVDLVDADSSAPQQPEFARNDIRARDARHLLVYANCTHLGCEVAMLDNNGFEGFECPCHFSRFDGAGRVEEGSAARLNLEVPDYDYIGRQVIRLRKSTSDAA